MSKQKRQPNFTQIEDKTIKKASEIVFWKTKSTRMEEELNNLEHYYRAEIRICREILGRNNKLVEKNNYLVRRVRKLEREWKKKDRRIAQLTAKLKRRGRKYFKKWLKRKERVR